MIICIANLQMTNLFVILIDAGCDEQINYSWNGAAHSQTTGAVRNRIPINPFALMSN